MTAYTYSGSFPGSPQTNDTLLMNGVLYTYTSKGSWEVTSGVTSEGTAIKSTGETGGTKLLREDGDGTSSWQTITTITGGQASAITANTAKTGITSGQASAITANTSKTTNATHTGDVTGDAALTIGASKVITSMILDDNVTPAKLANSINSEITANTAKTGITSGQASAITANTSKVTNATHTGDVTGSTELTIAGGAVETGMIADDAVTADKLANSINSAIAANTAKNTNVVQTTVSGNAGTATTLATARTIAGVSFNGSASISLNNNAITNGAGYTTNVGDITGVTAGSGMSGGGTSGTVTLTNSSPNVVQTTVSGNAGTVTNGVYTTGTQTIGGAKTFSDLLTVSGGSDVPARFHSTDGTSQVSVSDNSTTGADYNGLRSVGNIVSVYGNNTKAFDYNGTVFNIPDTATLASGGSYASTFVTSGGIEIGQKGLTTTGKSRGILMEVTGDALSNGEAAGRIFFPENNAGVAASNNNYGWSLNHDGTSDTDKKFPISGANVLGANTKFAIRRHDNNIDGVDWIWGVRSSDTVNAVAFSGSGAALTSLSGSNISSGTVATARGGTGATSTTGSGNNVLSANPTITGGMVINGGGYIYQSQSAGTWVFTRMHNGSNYFDVATNSSDNSGAWQVRPNANASYAFKISSVGDVTVNGSITNNAGSYTSPTASNVMNTAYGSISLGPMNASYGHIYTDRANFYFNKTALYASGSTIWHAGNDGSGSTLDADLLDGVQGAAYALKTGTDNLIINHASPTLYLQDTNHNSAMLHCNSDIFYILRGGDNSTTWTQVNSQWPFYISLANNNANFGGNVVAAGNVTAYSDRKLKDNLEVIPNALAKVSTLTGYTYDRIDVDGSRQSGLIAQDVQKVLPEVINTDVHPDTKEETLTVAYGNMVGLLVEAIKELNTKVDDLQKQLESK